ncbi:hypothetical protein BC827DRAFT_1219518 [Russula dissimulans]|nr:hypothetical protein BC827DRAFT_1219518 [Russula dissimulans]
MGRSRRGVRCSKVTILTTKIDNCDYSLQTQSRSLMNEKFPFNLSEHFLETPSFKSVKLLVHLNRSLAEFSIQLPPCVISKYRRPALLAFNNNNPYTLFQPVQKKKTCAEQPLASRYKDELSEVRKDAITRDLWWRRQARDILHGTAQ